MTERQHANPSVVRDPQMDKLVADALRLEGLNPDRLVIQSGWTARPSDDGSSPTTWYVIRVRFADLYVWSANRSQKIFLTVEHAESDRRIVHNPRARTAWALDMVTKTLPLAHAEWTYPKPIGRAMKWPSGYPRPDYAVAPSMVGVGPVSAEDRQRIDDELGRQLGRG